MKHRRVPSPQPGPALAPMVAQPLGVKLQAAAALHQQGQLDQAEVLYKEILQAQPRHFDALQLLATLAVQRNHAAQAMVLFELALKIHPANASVLSNRGSALLNLNRPQEALDSCDRALQVRPDYAEALSNRGNALWALKRPAEALQSFDHALKLKPDYAEALSNRGAALRALNRHAEALDSYDRALRIRPAFAQALNNRGAALQDLNRHAEALEDFGRALQVQPDHAEAHVNEALCRLILGDFAGGWVKYEWRWKKEPGLSAARNFSQPLWLGKESLAHKTILLHAEQGLGDTLQFCRYAKQVAALGATVVLEVQPALKTLLQDLEGVSLVLGRGESLPDVDYHCPLLSLPLAFKVDLGNISGEPYLHSEPQKRAQWQERLGPSRNKRIGLVWSGSTGHQNDHNRSLALADIRGLLSEHADCYCLQKELRPADQATLATTPGLTFLGDSFQDFSDTAAVVALMDLVITVDTSVAHLAGAMGKEVWLLLAYSPDWRWLLERSDSPWYGSARLFRQIAPGDWAGVLTQVQAALTLRLSDLEREPEQAPVPVQKPPAMTAQAQAAQLAQAVNLHQQGQLDQAEALYKEILRVQPQHFDALQLLATMAVQRKEPATAMALFDQALKISPDHPSALNNRGNALRDLNRPEEALASYEHALRLQPDYAEALANRGAALRDLERYAEALESYDRALRIKPDYALALSNRGNALRALKRPLEALASYDRALGVRPDDAQVLSNRGNALQDLERPEESLQSFDHALKIRPDFAEALSNRGKALWDLRRPAEALASYERALQIKPDFAGAWSNRGGVLRDLMRHAEAMECFGRALQLEPGNAEAHWNEALCRLILGDFAGGWAKYEWRWKKEPGLSAARNFSQPLWLGKESLAHKTILLHAEQGLGDTLQFCRYAEQVAALGATVVLEVQPALKTLLQDLEGVGLVLGRGERLPDVDYHCPLLSLPLAFKVDLGNISGEPYLHSDPNKRQAWQERLGPSRNKRIGLVWSGSTGHQNDHNRSLALADIRGLLSERAEWYCLQKELRPADRAALATTPGLTFLGDSFQDFSDTAAVVALMDLVITVDTSVAHLAGAMGKEVWLLLAYSPDWRWLLERSDSPWYGSARLFRQSAPGDWAGVLAEVQQALRERLGGDKGKTHTSVQAVPAMDRTLAKAMALHRQGDLDKAEALYKEILTAQPRHFDALQMLATIAAHRKDNADAVVLFEQALRSRPDHVGVLNDLGNALQAQGKMEEALQSYGRALDVQPDFVDALVNRGNAWRRLQRVEDALASYERALQVSPDHAEVLNNRGVALLALGRPQEALASYQKAWRVNPDYAEAHWNEALCQLLLGDFAQGWKNYEWRWKRKLNQDKLRNFSQPLWLGKESLAGKTILLHAEQGLGDTLQFCRYAEQVAALGATVVLEVQPALKTLLQDLEGVSLVLGRGESLPDVDYHCPLLSLPLAFKVDLGNISGEPYLHSDPDKRQAWQERLGPSRNKRIGLVWSGSTGHQNDHNRSLALADIQGLLSERAEWYCLQKELRPADRAALATTPGLTFLGDSFQDFSDTAAVVALMDLVITVDTSVAHLAGAMGKEVWLLLAYSPDWRWLLGRSDSPWYGSARLFRQIAPGDWAGVLTQVQAALTLRLSGVQREPEPGPAPTPVPAQKPPAMTAQAQAALLAQAVGLHQQGQLDQAEALYKEILRVQPQHFDALQLLAMTEAQKNNPVAARVLFEQVLKIDPQHAGALNNHGNVLRALNRPEEALASYDRAIQVQPAHAEALMNRGNALWELQRPEEALASYDLALGIDPDKVDALSSRGSVLGSLKRTAQALESFDRVLQLRPDDAQALSNRGNALLDLERPEEALASCERALQIRPDFAEALSHRGNALRALNRHAEALASYDRALSIRPDYAEAWSNRGAALQDLRRHAEALESCARALQLEPGNAEAHWNEALCQLLLGDFAQGWKNYEWRWKRKLNQDKLRNFSQPLWLGKESLAGKTILLHAEQGLGDTLQFCRYAEQVAALGATVVLEVQPALKTLLQDLEGVSLVLGRGERLPDFDYHCPLLSLPLAFKADLGNISGEPYLHSEPQKRAQWQERLGASTQPRIGLVWSGSTGHQNDHNRSLALADMRGLLSERAEWYCLQKELRPADQATLATTPGLTFLGDSFQDFSDTAAVVALMDLVITVDTSVAHLAGAMGKEVWLLLAYSPDWRWLLERSDSPWYGSARLFRQIAPGDWAGVLTQVQAALTLRLP